MAKKQIVLDADTRIEVIEQLIRRIQEHYVFPDVAQYMEEDLRRRLSIGEYDQLTTAELFCLFLTAHLISPRIAYALGDDIENLFHFGSTLEPIVLLKTTNGGYSWQEISYSIN